MHHILARITFKPEAAAQGLAIMTELAARSREEKGCAAYQLFQQAEAPHVFQTVEEWADKAAADAHMATPHVGAAVAAAGPLFGAPPEILAYTRLA
ncbi:putative quinol monooxygenase [Variovorax sp. dw_954]|uniref:putative quinol monooxygenase n=1 Tax=Variovorax sp. dw_954 TaxID=2720078 RepID=UPI001BD4A6DA|nr:putative quinol monooxygenase [Variovorax sp. dw_954]